MQTNYKKGELEKLTKKELIGIAKDVALVGRHDMTKEQLIEGILKLQKPAKNIKAKTKAEKSEKTVEPVVKDKKAVGEEQTEAQAPSGAATDENTDAEDVNGTGGAEVESDKVGGTERHTDSEKVLKEVMLNGEKMTVTTVTDEKKAQYIQDAPVGTIVAFINNEKGYGGKVMSAAMVNRSSKRKVVKLETKRGTEFIVPYSDVLWVNTCGKWPNKIFELLKGGSTHGRTADTAKE